MITWEQRGNQLRGVFEDSIGNHCIIQERMAYFSENDIPKLRVGVHEDFDGLHSTVMLLSQEQAKELVYHLAYFSRFGVLPIHLDTETDIDSLLELDIENV